MTRPKVSVIVPCYNVEDYLDKCLLSLRAQTLKDIEIIVVDDGATDSSYEIARRHRKQDKRIKTIRQENQGLGYARNTGLRRASGEYISFIDSDDWCDPSMMESFYLEAKRTGAELVLGTFYEVTDNCRVVKEIRMDERLRNRDVPFHWTEERTIFYLPTPVWDKFYSRNLLSRNDIWFSKETCEDIDFKWKVFTSATSVSILPEPMLYYRVRGSSLTGGQQVGVDVYRMHDLARDWLKARDLYDNLYTEWSIRELSEIIYVSWKSRPALLSSKPFFAAYTNLFRKVVVGLDFERISHSFSYLPFSYVFLLLHVRRRNDPQEYRNILKAWDALEATAQPQRYLKLGKLRLVHVNTEDALSRSAIGDIDRSTDFFARVTHSSCSEPYPDEPDLQPAFIENGTVTLLPPVTLASGPPAVASMTLVADQWAKSLHFIVNTFQPERAKEISVVARLTQDSVESRVQVTCTFPQPLWYDLMSIDLSSFDLSKPLILTLFAVGDGTFPMHYTGVRASHFQFV